MQISVYTFLAVGLGGFLGAIARLYITSYFGSQFPHTLPFGTMFVNIVGSFIIGCLFAVFMAYPLSVHFKSFLTTGFLGALTTYSTFAMETFFLFNVSITYAFINIFANVMGTIISAGIGFRLLSYLLRF